MLERLWRGRFMAMTVFPNRLERVLVTITAAPPLLNSTNVFAEQEIQSPIEGDANLFVQSGQFAQVNRAPKPPGEEAGEVESENPRHAGSTTD